MALITCPECGRKGISHTAVSCPECGFAIKEYFEQEDNARQLAEDLAVVANNQKKEYIREEIKQRIRWIVTIGLFIYLVVSFFAYCYPTFITKEKAENVAAKSKYKVYETFNVAADDIEINASLVEMNEVLSKISDKSKWDVLSVWAKDSLIRRYHDKSADIVNEKLNLYYDSGERYTSCVVNVEPTITDGKRVYPACNEIKEASVPAVQIFDLYLPVDGTYSYEDLAIALDESQESLKLVSANTQKENGHDYIFNYETKYLVYKDTPESAYNTDYVAKLFINNVNEVDGGTTKYCITRIMYISKDIKDSVYITGGKSLSKNPVSIFKFVFNNRKDVLRNQVKVFSGIGEWLVADLIAIAIVFPGLFILIKEIVKIIFLVFFGLIDLILSIILPKPKQS